MEKHYMNPAVGRHMAQMGGQTDEAERVDNPVEEKSDAPDIHVHTHSKGHSVHVHHKDGRHEEHKFNHGDHEGIGRKVTESMGGQSSGGGMEDSAAAGNEQY